MTNVAQNPENNQSAFSPEAIARLEAIDAEMESVRTYRLYRTVHAVRNGHRIAVHFSRDRSQYGYYASAQLFGRRHSAWGRLPSHAFAKIIDQLLWTIDGEAVRSNYSAEAASLLATTGGVA